MDPELLDDSDVRVMMLADGDDGRVQPGAVLVQWERTPDGRLVQVYVNGELAAISSDPDEREMIVPTDAAELLAIKVLAVEEHDAETDFAGRLTPQQRGRRALLSWPRLNDAPPGSAVNLFGNGGAGAIDFATPLNDEPIPWYGDSVGRWGFGLGGFGQDDFGRGGARAVGLGRGAFGLGEFGFDAELARWMSEPLTPGTHQLAAVARDRLGNEADDPPTVTLTIAGLPATLSNLSADGGQAGQPITLSWTTTSN